MKYRKIGFLAGGAEGAEEAHQRLSARYDHVAPEDADVIVALGGDGLMLEALHRFMNIPKPIYGMNRGTVGFLMNNYDEEGLVERPVSDSVQNTVPVRIQTLPLLGRCNKQLPLVWNGWPRRAGFLKQLRRLSQSLVHLLHSTLKVTNFLL